MAEPLMDLLSSLPDAAPDAVRSERLRARCRARVEQHASRPTPRRQSAVASTMALAWRPLAALFSLVYVAAVIVTAIGLYRGL